MNRLKELGVNVDFLEQKIQEGRFFTETSIART